MADFHTRSHGTGPGCRTTVLGTEIFVPHGKFQRGANGEVRNPQAIFWSPATGLTLVWWNWLAVINHDSFLFISCRGSGLEDFYFDLTIWHIQNSIVTNGCYLNLTHPMDFKRSPTLTNHKGPIQVTWNQVTHAPLSTPDPDFQATLWFATWSLAFLANPQRLSLQRNMYVL